MTFSIQNILNINTWHYKIKKYLSVGVYKFKYHYQSEKKSNKSILLVNVNSELETRILEEIIFYFKKQNNWDVALFYPDQQEGDNINVLTEQLEISNYKKIIVICDFLKNNKKLTNSSVTTFIDSIKSKKEIWKSIQ